MNFKKLLIVIPTRNRAELAMNAVRSVLSQNNCEFELIVSDNSTEEDEVRRLKFFCEEAKNDKLKYIRPPEPLSMSKHWEWIKIQMFELYSQFHLVFLTDRFVFKEGSLSTLQSVCEKFPDKIVSYHQDSIDDSSPNIVLLQTPGTGYIFEVKSEYIIQLSSQARWHHSMPRMLNCAVPRSILEKITIDYNKVFDSISPDFSFAYKVLDIEESFLYIDKSLFVNYGLNKSNGTNASKGLLTKDVENFLSEVKKDGLQLNFAAPVPEFHTLTNAVVNEYCFVKERSKSSKFPHLQLDDYFNLIESDLKYFNDTALKNSMERKLSEKRNELTAKNKGKLNNNFQAKLKNLSTTKLYTRTLLTLERLINKINLDSIDIARFIGMNIKQTKFELLEIALTEAVSKNYTKRKGFSDLEYTLNRKLPKLGMV